MITLSREKNIFGFAGRFISQVLILIIIFHLSQQLSIAQDSSRLPSDTTIGPGLRYPINEDSYPFSTSGGQSPLLLKPPSNVRQQVEYDPETGQYVFTEKVGELDYRPPSSMSLDEFKTYDAERSKSDYWREKSLSESGAGPSFMKNLRLGSQSVDKVFGSDVINIVPKGSTELMFGYSRSTNENPLVSERYKKTGSFIFKPKIMINVTGSIGDKMEVGINYNTEATFDFENKTKLEYSGKEDEIIKKIEAGDVSFNLPGSLITGSQNLFGIKTELQFGHLTVTSVVSNQEGESSSINVKGGAQLNEFEIDVDEYDVNRHFFLSQFFRDHYNEWMSSLPYIESQLKIQQLEVWVVNKQNDYTEVRDIVGLMDLAESYGEDGLPNFFADVNIIGPNPRADLPADNSLNALYSKVLEALDNRDFSSAENALSYVGGSSFTAGRDYVILESARPLSEREYTLNEELGYISLNSSLRNDEILAVAFTFTYKGKTYQVGDLSGQVDASGVLILKLLKGTTPSPNYPIWDLMMKNVYSLGAYQLSAENFVLNIFYRNDKTGVPVNYLSDPDSTNISSLVQKQPLLKVLDMDNLDSRNEPNPDGVFDYVEGLTVNSKNGRIYFPLLEPFGSDLRKKITEGFSGSDLVESNHLADKYVFEELYNSTQTNAEQIAEKNKFLLKGEYQSSSGSDIQLNAMNISKGSVVVTAGGRTLTENADYTVDYTLGRVKIINPGLLESGTPIRVTLENNSLYSMQSKTLLGTHLDYKLSENFDIGATVMHLKEIPQTRKVSAGEEPISNTIWGLNTSYRTQSQLLTTIIDKLPFIETKQPSSISLEGEFAQLIPGQSKEIHGYAYIDDFEAAQTKIEMKTPHNWYLSSAPRGNKANFETADMKDLVSGYNRAKLAWYNIDRLFYDDGQLNPGNDSINEDLKSHYARSVEEKEIFPTRENDIPGLNYLSILNMAFYPDERGPYNYNPDLTSDGKLNQPTENWGGIMREIISSDFETSNIEFIEFWLMDPYLENTSHSGGDLYLHLGEISEDILRDTRKSFEGGLPSDSSDLSGVETTVWGRVPNQRAYTNTFVEGEGRALQDAGLDGLIDRDEVEFFTPYLNGLNPEVKNQVISDPSGDDFMYFLDDSHNEKNHGIFDRYKNFNNLEGNSPPTQQGNEEYMPSNSYECDIEDINRDNTMNGVENYFQYRISLRPEDINEVGKNFIVDQIVKEISGFETPVRWIQFRIPLSEWEKRIGDMEDFKSIRFIRLLLSGFEQKVYLRFATLDMVRSDWRRYNYDLSESSPVTTEQPEDATFEVSAVNYEENSERIPVNYILPPGITRAIDPSTTQQILQNEQSLSLKVKDLEDGDARSVFKNEQRDFRQYKKLKMWLHTEALPDMEGSIEDGDLTAFIRIGSDYQNNYYEIEVPLHITDPDVYPDTRGGREKVWRDSIELDLSELISLKQERNDLIVSDPINYSSQSVYSKPVIIQVSNESIWLQTIKVKGNPNIANVRQIMLGVRNPGDATTYAKLNDGLPKSAEIWFNELRLSEFNNKGGWAANGRMQAQLADFGVVSVAGNKSTPGFGSIEEKVEERSMEETNQYDISSNLEFGKFFPEKAQVSIPVYIGTSKTIINPEYYPKDPDIKLKDILKAADGDTERDSIKRLSQDFTSRASVNITNMRWNKKIKKFDVISPSNITASVGYTQTRSRNYSTEYNNLWKYNANLNYVFNTRPKTIQPLKNSKSFKKPAYKIIKEINFNPYPSRFSFMTSIDRSYQEIKLRNVYDDVELLIEPTVSKDFTWDRKYDLKWDFTRGLKLDYSATNIARIDEPLGQQDLFKANNELWKDSVWKSIQEFGRNMSFTQKFDLSYMIPINKIPLFNWVSLTTSYGNTYSWIRGEKIPNREDLGNTIKNSNNFKVSSNLNLKTFYNKIGYIKKLETKYSKTQSSSTKKKSEENARYKTVEYEKRTFLKKDDPKNIVHNLGTEDIEITVLDESGNKIEVNTSIVNSNKIVITAAQDYAQVQVKITGKIPKGQNPLIFIADNTLKLLTGLKTVNISWSTSSGSVLPGFLPETDLFGFDLSDDFYGAPGYPFVFGIQDTGMVRRSIDNSWITESNTLSKPFEYNKREELSIRGSFEPFDGLRVDLTGTRSYSEYKEQLFFRDDSLGLANYHNDEYFIDNMYTGGSFSISVITIFTAFEKQNKENEYESKAFNQLRKNRPIISARRYRENINDLDDYYYNAYHGTYDGYFDGYGPTSQDVLIPAFLSAYTGTDPEKISFNAFFWNIMPNWKITFDGLSKIPFVQKFVKNLTINHSYKSVYSITGFGTNVNYFDSYNNPLFSSADEDADVRTMIRDDQNNFIPEYQFNSVSIKEQLSPLIGFDMTWHNSLLTKFEFGKTRAISLSLNNNQINESRNTDYTIGAGYRFKEVPLNIKTGGSKKQIKSDLNVRFDATLRDNITIIRFLTTVEGYEENSKVTTGTKKVTLGLTADYVFSDKFSMQLFIDRDANTPHTSSSFRTTETNIGVTLRLTL